MEVAAGFSWTKSGNLPVTNYLSAPFNKSDYPAYGTTVVSRDTLMKSFGLNPISFSNLSEFLQFYYMLGKFRILGGVRYDINTLYGNRFSPQLAVLYKSGKKTDLRLSAGTAYKAPPSSIAFQSLAYAVAADQIFYQVVPNPDLQPEKFTTADFGINTVIRKRVRLEQNFYFYRITNHIVPEKAPADRFSLLYPVNDSVSTWINNISSLSNVYGSQTTLRISDVVPSIKLNAELSLSFLERRDRLPQVDELVREYFKFMPRHEGKLKVSMVPYRNLYINIESHWMSKWLRLLIPFEELYDRLFSNIDGYYAMNLMGGYNISPELRAFIKVTNVFDEAYGGVNATFLGENLVYNPQLRRSIRIGLSYNLN